MPMSSMVRRSASRIWAVFRTRIRLVRLVDSTPRTPRTHRILLHGFSLCVHRVLGVGSALVSDVRCPSMAATVNVNGRVSNQEHATISIFDHGFLYGEGV